METAHIVEWVNKLSAEREQIQSTLESHKETIRHIQTERDNLRDNVNQLQQELTEWREGGKKWVEENKALHNLIQEYLGGSRPMGVNAFKRRYHEVTSLLRVIVPASPPEKPEGEVVRIGQRVRLVYETSNPMICRLESAE